MALLKTFFAALVCYSLLTFPAHFPKQATADVGQQLPDALPLNFELNQGQTNQRVKFLARSDGYVLFLTATEAVMALDNPATRAR